ncbi:MAG: hypothetical protein XE04_0283 [Marinimicrobia bacterium 46_43]|nr:MAG: hypothetical protein XE04_0283 [Marinimicrobia bacterium 46_43]
MLHFGVFYPRGGGRYLTEIIYSISRIIPELNQKNPIYPIKEARSWKLEVGFAALCESIQSIESICCLLSTAH